MKKIVSIILALAMCLSAVALLASCAGESAYEIAVRNGFTGTEEEWIKSLQGEKGDTGDAGADGAKGEKGDQGDKGDTGAAGAPGEKGDKGDKGDAGATGAPGTNGNDGSNGADALPIEIRVNTETGYIEWSYKGTDTWANLVSLESLKGDKGDKGDTGAAGVDGLVPHIKDGLWWIGDTPTNVLAGEQTEEGEAVVVTCQSITFSTDDCAIWKGGMTPSLKINYVLVNEAGEVVREGTTNVTANMISDVTPAFNGAGEYTATVKFLDKVAEDVLLNITTEYELVNNIFQVGAEPKYEIKKTYADGSFEIIEVGEDMISNNQVDTSKPGVYPITITTPDGLSATLSITVAIYYQNFESIENNGTASILAQLGWMDNINNFVDGQPTELSKGEGLGSHTYIMSKKTYNAPDMKLSKYWADTGISKNLSDLYIEDGKLKIDNATNNPNGINATFKLTEDGYMETIGMNHAAYTIQYDITFGEDCAQYLFATVIPNYQIATKLPMVCGHQARVYYQGFVNPVLATCTGMTGRWYFGLPKKELTGGVLMSGGSIGINSTYPVDNRILSTLFGESSTSNSTLKNKTITVKTQYVPVQGQNTFGEVYELTVYVKSGDGDFELIAKTDYITARKNKDYATFPSTQAGYTNAMALVLGAYGVSTVTSASVANVEANGSSHQVKNVINYGQNQIDGDSADERISAAGIVYIDNFVAWAGTEELVEGTVFYNAD